MSIINIKSQTELSGFYVVYYGSTLLEKKGFRGVSHLLEHLKFKVFDKFNDEMDADGLQYNAYTDFNEIVYYITGLEDKLSKWRDLFFDKLQSIKITNEEFLNEKKIVLEEYSDCFSDKESSHALNLYRKLFNNYTAIGNKEDLEKLDYYNFLKFHEKVASKPSKIINVSKTYVYKNNKISFDDYLSNAVLTKKINKDKNILELTTGVHDSGKTSLIMMSDVIKSNFSEISFLNQMLSFGLRSPLYQEIREKRGLVYGIGCSTERYNRFVVNLISTQTSDKNVKEIIDLIDMIFKNRDKYMTKERFNIIKERIKVDKRIADINRYAQVKKYITPPEFSLADNIEKIKYDKCMEVFDNQFDINKFYISEDKKEFI